MSKVNTGTIHTGLQARFILYF